MEHIAQFNERIFTLEEDGTLRGNQSSLHRRRTRFLHFLTSLWWKITWEDKEEVRSVTDTTCETRPVSETHTGFSKFGDHQYSQRISDRSDLRERLIREEENVYGQR